MSEKLGIAVLFITACALENSDRWYLKGKVETAIRLTS